MNRVIRRLLTGVGLALLVGSFGVEASKAAAPVIVTGSSHHFFRPRPFNNPRSFLTPVAPTFYNPWWFGSSRVPYLPLAPVYYPGGGFYTYSFYSSPYGLNYSYSFYYP